MTLLTDTLTEWIQGLQSLRSACARVNTSTNHLTLNAFANSILKSLLPNSGNVTNFIKYANQQFAKSGPNGWTISPPLNTTATFAELINFTLWHTLPYSVERFVQSFCPASSTNSSGDLILTIPLTVAFPLGAGDPNWKQLNVGIKSVNLDEVLASTALTTAAGQLTPPPPCTLSDLITTLSTIK